MRRTCFTLMLGVLLGSLGTWVSVNRKAPAAHAETDSGCGAGTPSGNGDVNGDGVVDLSDAVYTLNWLFRGSGAPPVPIECPSGALPATGQTKCYDTDGTEIDCGSADWPGQDGFYRTGCSSVGRGLGSEATRFRGGVGGGGVGGPRASHLRFHGGGDRRPRYWHSDCTVGVFFGFPPCAKASPGSRVAAAKTSTTDPILPMDRSSSSLFRSRRRGARL
jgi:hypothetical protein